MDAPSEMVVRDNDKILVRFDSEEKAKAYAVKYNVIVVKEQGKDIWYTLPTGVNQVVWVEE